MSRKPRQACTTGDRDAQRTEGEAMVVISAFALAGNRAGCAGRRSARPGAGCSHSRFPCAAHGAKGARMRTKRALSLVDARKIVDAARREAEQRKWNVSIAVVDDGGFLLALERMDGAGP